MVVYLRKGDLAELRKECFPNTHTPRFFLDEQVFKLCYVSPISEASVTRLLVD